MVAQVPDGEAGDPMDVLVCRENGDTETRRDVLAMLGAPYVPKVQEERIVLEGVSCMLLPVDNRARVFFHKVLSSKLTEVR